MKVNLFFTKLQVLLLPKAFIALLIFTLLLPATLPQTTYAQTAISFSTPLNISNTPSPSEFPALAVDKNGTAHVFWLERHQGSIWDYSQARIFYATKTKVGSWSEPITISGDSIPTYLPVPAVDESGNIHVVWTARNSQFLQSGMFYATKPSGGSWSEPVRIPGTVEIPRSIANPGSLAVNESGTLHLVWHGGDGVDNGWYATKAPGENWTEPTKFLELAHLPNIAFDSNGTLHLVTHVGQILYTNKPPGGSWSTPVNIGPVGVQMPTLTVDSADTVHVVWRGGPCPDVPCPIGYTAKPTGGEWSTPVPISLQLTVNGANYPSLIAVGRTLHLVWQEGESGPFRDAEIMYATKPSGEPWSTPINISNKRGFSGWYPRIAVGGDLAHVTWLESDPDSWYQDTWEIYWTSATVDTSPPVITPIVNGTLGNNNWYTSNVNISWNVDDPESEVTSTIGCDPSSVATDTTGVTFTCQATSAGGTASQSVTVKRDATAPTVAITSPDNFAVVPTGTIINFSATDNLSGIQSVVGSLSDGTTTINITTGYQVTQAGVYTLTVGAMDSAGNTASETRFFVVYDPAAGFATGSGLFIPGGQSSDFGDFLPNINNTSLARFGFVVKYNPGASTPNGQLEFQYRQGDFNLNSSGIEWLVVVNNNWAKFQGQATIKGLNGEFPFRVDARDGDYGGGNQPDRFIIKIWAPGVNPDLADPIYKASGDLQGGNIIIHTN